VLYLKKIVFRTSRLISIKLGTIHPWMKRITDYTNKGQGPFERGDNHKNYVGSFRNLLENHWTRKAQIYMKAF
jgi:hypothetical protein